MMKTVNSCCPFCGSHDLKFQETFSNPVFLDIRASIFNISATIQKKNLILKCMKCSFEPKFNRKVSVLY